MESMPISPRDWSHSPKAHQPKNQGVSFRSFFAPPRFPLPFPNHCGKASQVTVPARQFPQHDATFHVTAITNTSGTVQERYTPDPFGVVTFRDASGNTISASAKDWVFLHQGGQADILGHYDFRNRNLSRTLGRWLTNDPLGFDAGDNNFYGYLANGPGNGLDPSGLERRNFLPDGPPGWYNDFHRDYGYRPAPPAPSTPSSPPEKEKKGRSWPPGGVAPSMPYFPPYSSPKKYDPYEKLRGTCWIAVRPFMGIFPHCQVVCMKPNGQIWSKGFAGGWSDEDPFWNGFLLLNGIKIDALISEVKEAIEKKKQRDQSIPFKIIFGWNGEIGWHNFMSTCSGIKNDAENIHYNNGRKMIPG